MISLKATSSARPRPLLGALAISLAALAIGACSSEAAMLHTFIPPAITGSGATALAQPQAIAVDQSDGSLYVIDTGNFRIEKFDKEGNFVLMFGKGVDQTSGGDLCTAASGDTCQAGAQGAGGGFDAGGGFSFFDSKIGKGNEYGLPFIAVDNSAGPSHGDVYVSDHPAAGNNVVDKFDSSGAFVSSNDGSAASGGAFADPIYGIAVDSSGVLYVIDFADRLVKFAQDGSFLTEFNTSLNTGLAGLAVDSAGRIYKGRANGIIVQLDPSGSATNAEFDPTRGHSILAVDPSNDEVFVARRDEGVVVGYDPADNVLEGSFEGGQIGTSTGIAVYGKTHRVYVADGPANAIEAFDERPYPAVSTGPATAISEAAGTLNGTVNSFSADPLTDCHFEYTAEASLGGPGTKSAPCVPGIGEIPADQADHQVSAEATALAQATTYRFRLVAANANGPVRGAIQTFVTHGPAVIDSISAISATSSSAQVQAKINPFGLDTTYRFEYVDDASFQADQPDGFAQAKTTPVPDGDLGSGTVDANAYASLEDLTPATVYHLRVLAANSAGGPPSGLETTFTTAGLFGFLPGREGFDSNAANEDGSLANQAGSHPFALITDVNFDRTISFQGIPGANGDVRDTHVNLPPGLLGNPTVVGECSDVQFHTQSFPTKQNFSGESCPDSSQIGEVLLSLRPHQAEPPTQWHFGVYNLTPPPGAPAMFGFNVLGFAVPLTPHVRGADYGLTVDSLNISQVEGALGAKVTIWGTPWAHSHDAVRGFCLGLGGGHDPNGPASCPVSGIPRAYLTLPTSCAGPLPWSISADSWQGAGGAYLPDGEPDLSDPEWKTSSFLTHDNQGNPLGMEGCNKLPFSPELSGLPTTDSASSPTGLDVDLDVNDEGLTNPDGLSQAAIKKIAVTLPEGMTLNPSAGAGLGVCTPADFAKETLKSAPGAGCPNSSKVGDVTTRTPLLPTPVNGALYIAKPFDNPFGSLVALYMVIKDPSTGVLVKTPGRVEANPESGQLTTTFDNLPQLPYSHFALQFSQGQTSPLVSPPACGTYQIKADLTPWSNPEAVLHDTSRFQVTKGAEGGPCPSGGVPAFDPEVTAGTLNNNAGSFSPFYLRMSRKNGEQEITSFSAKLPPGLSGKLAGIGVCSDAAIEAAKQKTGVQEEEHPSCPQSSEVGRTLVGAGVGSVLASAPGKVYLAGPYHGSPISIASITAATVGPFDLGTVVVRSAFKIDPETARVSVDAKGSDPIPHIIKGFPVHVRDIRVYIDRPGFTLNPTDCDPFAVTTTLTGSGANFASPADDVPASQETPFQVANCAALPFGPKLSFKLKGATKRSGHPALTATLTARPGEANIAKAAVTLPHSEFLDQAHIKTVCTRVQFAQEKCPPGSVYGFAKAVTPLLDQPLEGPVYLRSSNNPLPDLVVDLDGQIHVVLDGRVDSVKGGIRNTFEAVPDAPVKTFTLTMQGGKKGLLENSKDLCESVSRATVRLTGQNGKAAATHPEVIAQGCAKQGNAKKKKRGAHRAHHG